MRRALVAGNWKMNGTKASVSELLDGIKRGVGDVKSADVVVCPPFVYLSEVMQQLAGTSVRWGAQNVSDRAEGAFTGEISARMLNDFECTFVIVGHSERRAIYGEDDEVVAKKFAAAQAAGMIPILCVGETLDEREQGVTQEVVARQLDAVIALSGVAALGESVIAYEPVWAIGTGRTATPEQAQEVHAFIRSRIAGHDQAIAEKVQILYGGSVKASNAVELFGQRDIDGGLIGGASLQADEFLAICRAAS